MKLAVFLIILIINFAEIYQVVSLERLNINSTGIQKKARPTHTRSSKKLTLEEKKTTEHDLKNNVFSRFHNSISKLLKGLELKITYTPHISNGSKNKKVIFVPSDKNLNHYFIG